jgi:hypothetical protein
MPKKKDTTGDLSSVEKRFNDAAINIALHDPGFEDTGFMPAGLCHVFFPYKDPGSETLYVRKHGDFTLTMEATTEINPETGEPERLGLPYGAKPRMMLALLNTISIRNQTPELYLGNSLTEFIGSYLKMDTNGRTIRDVKAHMAKLAATDIKIHHRIGESKGYVHSARQRVNIIRDLDIWWTKSPNQRHLWGNALRFSDDYFKALQEHGVPLDLRALAAISHKPMAIDLYSFLAHRLHYLNNHLFITWKGIKDQFGVVYKNMDDFKKEFRHCLKMVKHVYPAANIVEDDNKGFILSPSHPPIKKATIAGGSAGLILPPNSPALNPAAAAAPKKRAKKPKAAPKAATKTQTGGQEPKGPQPMSEALESVLGGLFKTIQEEERKGGK